MECRELIELATDRMVEGSQEPLPADAASHLESCSACAADIAGREQAWSMLLADPAADPSAAFRARTLELLEDEMIRRRVRAFRPRTRLAWPRVLAYAAGWAAAALVGYSAARWLPSSRGPAGPSAASPSRTAAGASLEPEGAVSNVSFRPADGEGRIGVSFDVTSRKTVLGKPNDPAVASLLAYLVSRGQQTAGEKSRAIELVSSQYGAKVAPASSEIVAALTQTLRVDPNPGVRKKAADALAGFRTTPEIRVALLDALRNDRNPAVRLTAVEALAAAAREAPDARTIESLREKAVDPAENGFVRARAASALKSIEF